MAQKPYSIKFVLGSANKSGERIVYLRFYFSGTRLMLPTPIRIEDKYFDPGKAGRNPIVKHPLSKAFNTILENFRVDIETKATVPNAKYSVDYFLGRVCSGDTISDFIDTLRNELRGKLAPGTLKHYVVVQTKLNDYMPNAVFKDISLSFMEGFERHIRARVESVNTLNSNMKKMKAILNYAADRDLVDTKQFSKYSVPKYSQSLPVYLEESQINSFFNVARAAASGITKIAGYYFLLSCYTGYRISDLYAFNYERLVKDKAITVRAKKNGNIVSIPIFPKLLEILDYCKANPLTISEQEMRKQVKALAKISGINANVKVHSGRHSFAMLMMDKGLTVDEVAELLGDSKDIAKQYARITNKHLHRRVMEVMK